MSTSTRIIAVGIGYISLLANVSYAGMRAQNKPENNIKRTVAFIFGFPHSIITLLVVDVGSNRAYGIELPRNQTK